MIMNKKINVSIEKDEAIKYEKNSPIKTLLNFFVLHPLLNRLPARSRNPIRKTHKIAEEIIDYKTSHKALEAMYGGHEYHVYSKNFKHKFFHYVWVKTNNVKGVRNRLKLTEKEVLNHFKYLIQEEKVKHIRALSIASGSSRCFVDVLKKIDNKKVKIHVTFLDKNPYALEYSKGLIEGTKFHSNFSFEWIEGTANSYMIGLNENENYHLVEMVGLLDYFDDKKVTQTIQSIYDHLHTGGALVTANIIPNREQPFVTKAVGWRMIYRQPEEFIKLITETDFGLKNTIGKIEPMKVHFVVKAVKA